MQLRIIKPGLLSTIQDMGRTGYLSQAVPVSGAMDTLSARLANMALGNSEHDAVIELTYAATEFTTETDSLIAYAGGGALLMAAERELPIGRPLFLPAGTIVRLTARPQGCRLYLAVAGGFDVPLMLGSRSTYVTAGIGGVHGRPLKAGDIIANTGVLSNITSNMLNELKGSHIAYPGWSIARHQVLPINNQPIRIVPAHEFNWFNSRSVIDLLSTPYTLGANSNRMGYNLTGAPVNRLVNTDLLSTAVTPGTIQVTGSGSMVLLMADCQTTGGYPRIAQVAAVDMPLCGQLKPGDTIYFTDIDRHEAEILYIDRERELSKLAVGINSRYS